MRTHYICCACSTYFPVDPDTPLVVGSLSKSTPDDRLIFACCKACNQSKHISQKIAAQKLFNRPPTELRNYAITSELALVINGLNLLDALNKGHGLPLVAHVAYGHGATISIPGLGLIPRL